MTEPTLVRPYRQASTFTASAAFRDGWETFKQRPGLFIGTTALLLATLALSEGVISGLLSQLRRGPSIWMLRLAADTAATGFIGAISAAFYLRATDGVRTLKFGDLFYSGPFINLFAVCAVTAILPSCDSSILIIPGVLVFGALMFAPYLVIDQRSPISEALYDSIDVVSSNIKQVALLLAGFVGINLLGVFSIVGLFVAMPVTSLAVASAYRKIWPTGTKKRDA